MDTSAISKSIKWGVAVLAASRAVKEMFPDHEDKWFIVGGAPRDLLLGEDFNDVDVFISAGGAKPSDKGSGSLRRAHRRIITIGEDQIEVNLIFMKGDWTLQGLADRCDTGICQIGYDPRKEKFYYSDAFSDDFNDNTLTQTRETRSVHIDKLRKRWPNRTYLNPNNYGLDEPWVPHYDSVTGTSTMDKIN